MYKHILYLLTLITGLLVSCSSRSIQRTVNEELAKNPWHGPASEAFQMFIWQHYRIPDSLDEMVSFLVQIKEQMSEDDSVYLFWGNIDELIADLQEGNNRFLSMTDSCFYYTNYGIDRVEAVKQYSPQYYIDHLPKILNEKPNILDYYYPVFLNRQGHPIFLPHKTVSSFQQSVRKMYQSLPYHLARCDSDKPHPYQTIITFSRDNGISIHELSLSQEEIRLYSNSNEFFEVFNKPDILCKELLEDYLQLCRTLLQSYPEIDMIHFLASLATDCLVVE